MFIQSHTRLPSSIFTQEVYIHEKTDLSCYGSRYGGLKQIDPVGSHGEVIMDYSLYDARRAGFERVIFIIKHSIEKDFHEAIGARIANYMDVSYAYQDLEDLPEGYTAPDGREKPWGTCHAILAARDLIDAPFAVINADDYYSTTCFQIIYDYLSTHSDDDKYRYCMVGYQLKNTVTENGSVARGVCTTDADANLVSVVEHTQIETYENGIHFTEDKGATWQDIDGYTTVSMNLWGFNESFIKEAVAPTGSPAIQKCQPTAPRDEKTSRSFTSLPDWCIFILINRKMRPSSLPGTLYSSVPQNCRSMNFTGKTKQKFTGYTLPAAK